MSAATSAAPTMTTNAILLRDITALPLDDPAPTLTADENSFSQGPFIALR
jgi:hypothetical protein